MTDERDALRAALIARIATIYGKPPSLQELLLLSTPLRTEIVDYLDGRLAGLGSGSEPESAIEREVIGGLMADIGGATYAARTKAEPTWWQKIVTALAKYLRP